MGAQTPGITDHVINPVDLHDGTAPRIESPAPGPIGLDDGGSGGSGPAQKAVAEKVVGFARGKKDTRVGDGECFALVDKALKGAGAKSAEDYGPVGGKDVDYVWGSPVAEAAAAPGDIVQFKGYEFRVENTETGAWEEGERPHHTAIVERVDGDGFVTVLEQNVPKKGAVRRSQLYFRSGTFEKGGTTRKVDVKGTFVFYRPQPR